MNLYEALTEYCSTDAYPFHMPGHKRRAAFLCDPASIDLTEIDGFDDLHHARSLLLEAQARAAALYGSSETHFLVNGSTAGILAAIGACAVPGGCLLMARSSHRSAFNAAALYQIRTAYLYPERYGSRAAEDLNGPVDPAKVEEALSQQEGVCAVFITSPTYDGVVSDVAEIARAAHRHHVPLIVDEAHGAHFGMHRLFPASSVTLGADLVIHSLHKTLPALTQTALLHVNGPLVDRNRLRYLLSVHQTSSPSYVLMASIDQCVCLLSEKKDILFDAYAARLQRFYQKTALKSLSFLKTDDPSRILVRPPDAAALPLYHSLRERFHLQPEMAAVSYVLLLSSVCDDDEGLSRLSEALLMLDAEYAAAASSGRNALQGKPAKTGTLTKREQTLPAKTGMPTRQEQTLPAKTGTLTRREQTLPAEPDSIAGPVFALPKTEALCTIAQALYSRSEDVLFSASKGRVSTEFLMLYPPGVPLLVPGERIPAETIRFALEMHQRGYMLTGPADDSLQQIRVIQESV